MVGIEKSKAVIEAIGELVSDGISLAKGGIGFGSIGKIIEVIRDLKDVMENAAGALPEVKDLDPKESGELLELCYKMVLKAISSVKS